MITKLIVNSTLFPFASRSMIEPLSCLFRGEVHLATAKFSFFPNALLHFNEVITKQELGPLVDVKATLRNS